MTVPAATWAWTEPAPRAVAIDDAATWAWTEPSPPPGPPPDSWCWSEHAPRAVAIGDPAPWPWSEHAPRAVAIGDPAPWPWTAVAPAPRWALPAVTPRKTIYIAELSADGLDAYEVPVASIQMRRRDGEPTMISCVVPDAMTYLTACQAYQDGSLIIRAGSETNDGTRNLSELDRVTLDTIAYDVGVHSSSLTLAGYRTASNANPRAVSVSGVRYYGLQADGKAKLRANIDQWLRPGDTVVYGATSFTVSSIYVFLDAKTSYMEVSG